MPIGHEKRTRALWGEELRSVAVQQTGAEAEVEAATAWVRGISGDSTELDGAWRPGRGTSWAIWREELAVFEVLQHRGDSMRSLGSTWRGKTMLHAEEGVWLAERGMLAVHRRAPSKKRDTDERSLVARPGGTGAGGPVASAAGGSKGDTVSSPRFSGTLSSRRKAVTCPQTLKYTAYTTSEAHPVTVEETVGTGNAEEISRAEAGEPLDGDCRIVQDKDIKSPQAEGQRGASPFISIDTLHGVLSRAGVPWECYRAYAELKRRSFVVRRRPEDTVGRNDAAPRAPALSWFGEPPTAEGGSRPFLPVTFHVYAPNAAFRKRQPGSPDFWLTVCRYSDPMPSHTALISLMEGHVEVQRAKRDEDGDQPRGRDDDIRARGEVGQDAGATPFGRVRSRGDTSCAKRPQDLSTDCGRQSSSVGAVDEQGTQTETGGADGERGGQGSGRGLETGGGMQGLKIAVVSGDGNVHVFDVGLHVL